MKKVLITGATGFAGSFLTEHLVAQNAYEVTGTYITEEKLKNIASVQDKIKTIQVDLLDGEKVSQIIAETKPDLLFHLAALASPGISFKNPAQTMTTNITTQVNLLEAIRKNDLKQTRILIIASADMYGLVAKEDLPMDEDTPMRPTNPYAVSKIAQDYLGLQYFLTYKLPIIRVRPFNHIGPRQGLHFVISDFAKRIADIEKRVTPPVFKVGNLDAKRDFTDVRDTVRAYVAILEKGESGEAYNIGSGVSHTMSDIVEMMRKECTVPFTIEQDPTLLRPSDNPELLCDNTKIKQLTGWQPEIPLEKTLKDTLDYWRNID